ncbi:MAG: Eco57I restriction-modification methylase domain-containing protein, partial [bacterium]|nr:Eco57I restriction-modification methylase domain-containing protein [bacterium]
RRINPFDWQDEFKEVFSERSRTFWLVTFVTHNARVSDRMVEFGVQKGEPLIFTAEERERVADILSALWKEYGIPVVAGNVLSDHVHLVMAAENETELDEHVRKLKGASSYRFSREVRPSEGGHVWQQKFNRKPLTTERALHDAQEYVWNNHLKHDSAPPDKGLKPPCLSSKLGKGLQPLVPQPLVPQPLVPQPLVPQPLVLQPLVLQPLVPQPLEADKGLKPLASPLSPFVSPSPPYLERLRAACTSVEDAATIRGGFDAVIGNPPYGMVANETHKSYYEAAYATVEGRYDTFELFIERGLDLVLTSGFLSFIVPSPLLTNLYSRKLRAHLLAKTTIRQITNFGVDVFSVPTVHTCIIVVSKDAPQGAPVSVRKRVMTQEQLRGEFDYSISQVRLGNAPNHAIDIFVDPSTSLLLSKVAENAVPLGQICHIRQCIKTGNDDEYVKTSARTPGKTWKPTLRGRSIGRYDTREANLYVKYGPWLARNWQNTSFYETPKLAVRETGARIIATLDLENRYFLSSLYAVYPKAQARAETLSYLLAIVNCRLATYFLKVIALDLTKGAFTKFRTNQLARLPIRTINFSDKADKARHDKMVSLVEKMLELNKDLQKARTDTEQTRLKRQIAATDKQIDQLVYELYGLTEEEIRIVEGTEGKDLRPET